ncbi:MAG TPA: DUF1134 domain-containing protein [Caulobacteraceae bacterium]|nr:DUF1134 domain-containing protein [Caulobacteraceae bacterium]
MDRRLLIASGIAALGTAKAAFAQPEGAGPTPGQPSYPTTQNPPPPGPREPGGPLDERDRRADTYSSDELVNALSDFFGVTAESAGAAIERIFKDNGRPTAYIAGEEASGALTIGLRYGRGLLYMKNQPKLEVFWQGPSIGWDVGGNGARVFTLCYNLQYPDAIFRRFPGVEGTAYLVGGMGVNYQRAEDITLAPIRAGVGVRLGANVGYLAYSRKRRILPF